MELHGIIRASTILLVLATIVWADAPLVGFTTPRRCIDESLCIFSVRLVGNQVVDGDTTIHTDNHAIRIF